MAILRDGVLRRRCWCTLLIATGLLAIAACGRSAPAAPPAPRRVLAAERYRAPDALLASPELQRLVDAQIDRDADALVAALGHGDPVVRARAAFALASIQDTSAAAALFPLLSDPDPRVRSDAAFALGQSPSFAGAAALLDAALAEADTTVLVLMLDALGKTGGQAELRSLADASLVPPRNGSAAIAAALALAYARFGMRGLYDQEAAGWLIGALDAADPAVRQNAAYYFARSRDADAWAHLHRPLVRALTAYGRADRAAMHLLTALGRRDSVDDVSHLIDWLTEATDWAIRVNAARALGQHGEDSASRRALTLALGDASQHVRTAAATALAEARLTPAEGDTLVARLASFQAEPAVHGALLRAIARAGATDWVLERWHSLTDPRLRRSAAAAVAMVPGRAGFAALERAARDADSTVAAAAVEALTRRRATDIEDVDDPRYFAILGEALRTRDLAVASAAATGLADSVFEPLGAGPLLQSVFLQLSAPADLEAMAAIAKALGALRDPTAVPLLREARASTWRELRTAAAAALARITGEPELLPPGNPPPTPIMQWEWLSSWGAAPRLRLETERGVMVLELSTEQAPLTVQTVLGLASEGRYDGVPFHRVVANFVVQGGDVERGDGWGGPGFAIRSEFTRIPFLRGSVGMASSGKDTEGSQYFVTHSMQPHLDGRYTSFGALVEGLRVLDTIREGDIVLRATVTPTAEAR